MVNSKSKLDYQEISNKYKENFQKMVDNPSKLEHVKLKR
jgi:hypothetical protein